MKKNNGKPASVLLVAGALSLCLTSCSGSLTQTGAFTGTVSSNLISESIGGAAVSINDIYNEDVKMCFISDNTLCKEIKQADLNCEQASDQAIISGLGKIKTEDNNKYDISSLNDYCKYLDSKDRLLCPTLVLLNPENYSVEELELAAYQNLKDNGLTIADVEKELHNILVYSQNPTCCSAKMFDELVGTLYRTLGYMANPFSSYYVFSQKIHELSCLNEHQLEFGIYTCDTLKREGNAVKPISLEEYLDINAADNYGYQKIKMALQKNPNYILQDYLVELENLVLAQLSPSGVGEETWSALFGKLDATLDMYESLYGTYIDLAVYVHNTLYPDDELTLNEFGIYTSRSLKMPIS